LATPPTISDTNARRDGAVLALSLALLAIHTVLVWGSTSLMWGDIGRWSHEVTRMAGGELPYRDFQWHYPPLGLWVEGFLARLIGTDHPNLSTITTAIAVPLVVGFVAYTRQVLGRADAAIVALGLVLAMAHAQTVGAAIPLGLYSPAALVGTVCISLASFFFVRQLTEGRPNDALWMALWAGLAVLSKQDFWIPAAYIVTVTMLRTRRIGAPLVSAAVVGMGLSVIVATAGVGVLLPLAGGFGHATLAGGQGFPSWERITVDLFVLALVSGAFLSLMGLAAGRWHWKWLVACGALAGATGALFIAMTMRTPPPVEGELLTRAQNVLLPHLTKGGPLLRPSIGYLARRVSQTPIPVSLPPLLLLLTILRWRTLPDPRRMTVALLLGFAITLRVRRAFEGTEWFEFLFTLPVLVAATELLVPLEPAPRRRLRLAVVGVLAAMAAWGYRAHGRGRGTAEFRPVVTRTLRGNVRWGTNIARDYQRILATVDSLDPSRERPLYSFAFTGGWNYWLKRRNPYPFTQDFYFSAFNADSVLALPRPRGLLLFDLAPGVMDTGGFGAARFDLSRWEQPMVPGPYGFYDRPRFEKLKEGCTRVPLERVIVRIYQCP